MGYFISFVFLSQFIFIRSAFAYVDPGSGSYILQVLIGFALAGLYALKHYWAKILTFFTKKK
jgi:hypothetical protein